MRCRPVALRRARATACCASVLDPRFYKKHNTAKLDDPEFIKSVMKMSDDEIRSACMSRYRAAPEAAGNRMSM